MSFDQSRKARLQRARVAALVIHDPHRREPTKAELRAQLAEAARNTAALAHGKARREQAGAPG